MTDVIVVKIKLFNMFTVQSKTGVFEKPPFRADDRPSGSCVFKFLGVVCKEPQQQTLSSLRLLLENNQKQIRALIGLKPCVYNSKETKNYMYHELRQQLVRGFSRKL